MVEGSSPVYLPIFLRTSRASATAFHLRPELRVLCRKRERKRGRERERKKEDSSNGRAEGSRFIHLSWLTRPISLPPSPVVSTRYFFYSRNNPDRAADQFALTSNSSRPLAAPSSLHGASGRPPYCTHVYSCRMDETMIKRASCSEACKRAAREAFKVTVY